ncbi:hypothetical protein jhhlp_001217 [Lomentospora prolificans]|uniref:T6SS Phospholipase effector Tle1-like catalytic domain-containing protein n=1 Tax=Lomentospora prolificans TaxID=41688 RepID=A0A2N3NHV0_9PEZI|nr:hypothetical protein jhhlp_001217 [Lomentospora prolificans]
MVESQNSSQSGSSRASGASSPKNYPFKKRLIMCCDGTWMNSDKGAEERFGHTTLQVPSNVTRISRSFKRLCDDGVMQIINYESGVGTGSNMLDSVTGGAFGSGLSERVREAYQFICANYCDGDEIILIGFSRGAYTVRSVAGMIGEIGLLTRDGMELFYPIFKDMENWMDSDYNDPFPTLPFSEKPKGANASKEYKTRLEKLGLTRVRQEGGSGDLIKVKAVGVWDTVGSLGIPEVSWLSKMGVTYQFYDTNLSLQIEHAFQALALDETRPPFSAAVWERLPNNKLTTDLRQVWFPGNHGNIGGGWPDQGIANLSLAWMMDQLASVGVEFDEKALEKVFTRQVQHYDSLAKSSSSSKRKKEQLLWAVEQIHRANHPRRPWGLGEIKRASNPLYALAGKKARTPGLYKQVDAKTNQPKKDFLMDTNERIHPSVRVRLLCKGLGLDDAAVWEAEALKKWKLKRVDHSANGSANGNGVAGVANGNAQAVGGEEEWWGPLRAEQEDIKDAGQWVWQYVGPESEAPPVRVMAEERLGPYERYFLKLSGGTPNAYKWAGESFSEK